MPPVGRYNGLFCAFHLVLNTMLSKFSTFCMGKIHNKYDDCVPSRLAVRFGSISCGFHSGEKISCVFFFMDLVQLYLIGHYDRICCYESKMDTMAKSSMRTEEENLNSMKLLSHNVCTHYYESE